MVGSIARLRRLVAQDPAPWLLAGTALLTLGIWAAPVPELVFGLPAGSSSATACSCSTDACEGWTAFTSFNCNKSGVWEDCTKDTGKDEDCGGETDAKRVPESKWIYEQVTDDPTTWCDNDGDSGGITDKVDWQRDVSVTQDGSSGEQKLEFNPRLMVLFDGFEHAYVCNSGQSGDEIHIQTGLYAAMRPVDCSDWLVDTSHSSTGWAYDSHKFEWDGDKKKWMFTEGGASDETFNLSKNCNCGVDTINEHIAFSVAVDKNTGVKFGDDGDADAFLLFYADNDNTSCTPVY